MAIQSDFTSLFNSLISSLNSGGSVSASDTVSSFISSLTNATSSDTSKFNNLLDVLNSSIKSGKYSTDQIGDATKKLVNSISTEVNSGKYTNEQIGNAAKKIFTSMGSKVSNVTNNMSSSELGQTFKKYITETQSNLSGLSSSQIGNTIKNNIGTYTDKFKNGDLTMDDVKKIATTSAGKALTNPTVQTAKQKVKKAGTAIAKTTKKTVKKIKTKTSKKTKTTNSKLTQKAKTFVTKTKKIAKLNKVTVKPSTTNFASGETIYFDHDKARTNASLLQECCDAIMRDNNEIDNILTDLNGFWRGSLATIFADKFQKYRQLIKQYSECLQDGYDNLKNGSKAYSDFDDYFANKSI